MLIGGVLIKFMIKRIIRDITLKIKAYKKYNILLIQGKIINNSNNISIGSKFNMSQNCHLFAQDKTGESKIIIGDNVALNFNVHINADCGGKIIIGDNCMFGPYTVIRASNHKYDNINIPIYKQGHNPGEIIIESDVWIGAHTSILPNVKIGQSSVIGAGSVVTSDIPPFSVAAGVPAKIIKMRK
jgi:galactoside O-acetyltransferase